MSQNEDSFNDAELAILALEIAKDFKELSTKANVDPDDSFVSKFELEPDIIHPSRSISYSDAYDPKAPPIHDHDDYEKLTIVSLSANDSLKSIPSIPAQDTKHVPINVHQTKYHCGNTKWFTRIKNGSYSPQSSISIVSPSTDSVRNLSTSAYSRTKPPRHSNSSYPHTLSPDMSPLSDSNQAQSIDVAPCLSPTKSMPRVNSRRHDFKSSISKRRSASKRQSIQQTKTNKKRSKSRGRGAHKFRSDELNRLNTKKFYAMRSSKSLMAAIPDDIQQNAHHNDKRRSKSQYNRLKRKRKKQHRSDALHDIRYRSQFVESDAPKEPAPYFVKRARARVHGPHNTLIDLSLNEVNPFSVASSASAHSKSSSQFIHKTNNIRFLYCAEDDDEDEAPKSNKRRKSKREKTQGNTTAALHGSKSMLSVRNHDRGKQRRKSKLKMKAKSVGFGTNYDNYDRREDRGAYNPDDEYLVEFEDGFMVFINNNEDGSAKCTSRV